MMVDPEYARSCRLPRRDEKPRRMAGAFDQKPGDP
jgi:hypothetical protein